MGRRGMLETPRPTTSHPPLGRRACQIKICLRLQPIKPSSCGPWFGWETLLMAIPLVTMVLFGLSGKRSREVEFDGRKQIALTRYCHTRLARTDDILALRSEAMGDQSGCRFMLLGWRLSSA